MLVLRCEAQLYSFVAQIIVVHNSGKLIKIGFRKSHHSCDEIAYHKFSSH